jgi:hypothetical protein
MSIAQFRGRRSSALNCHGGQWSRGKLHLPSAILNPRPTGPHSAMSAVAFLSAIALATVEAKAEFRTSVIRVHLCASVVNPPLCSLRYLCKSIPPSPSSILHLLSSCLAPPGFCLGNVKDPDPHGRPVFIGLSWMSRMSTSLAGGGGGVGTGGKNCRLRIADCGMGSATVPVAVIGVSPMTLQTERLVVVGCPAGRRPVRARRTRSPVRGNCGLRNFIRVHPCSSVVDGPFVNFVAFCKVFRISEFGLRIFIRVHLCASVVNCVLKKVSSKLDFWARTLAALRRNPEQKRRPTTRQLRSVPAQLLYSYALRPDKPCSKARSSV